MTKAEKLTTADVHAALRLRYTQPEWALMFEVAASTGWAGRYADAVSMSMYPSRGLAVHGHEVKVSRSDWGREMKNPDKAEAISRYCDYWWVVTTPGIVKDGELPMGWGLMELQGGRLKIVTKAAQREPVPLDRAFVAAMLRRAHEIDSATVEKLVEAGLEQRTYTLRRAHEAEQRTMEAGELGLQGRPCCEHRADDCLQDGLAGHQLKDPCLEPAAADRADLQAKAAQHSADAALDVE